MEARQLSMSLTRSGRKGRWCRCCGITCVPSPQKNNLRIIAIIYSSYTTFPSKSLLPSLLCKPSSHPQPVCHLLSTCHALLHPCPCPVRFTPGSKLMFLRHPRTLTLSLPPKHILSNCLRQHMQARSLGFGLVPQNAAHIRSCKC